MATPDLQDANILDQEEVNWRLIIYPIVAVAVVVVIVFAFYSYLESQREAREADAHAAMVQAKTPEAYVAVADQYPDTSQATLALIAAADASFDKNDYDGASKSYQRVIDNPKTDPMLADAARLGLASTQEVLNKLDDAAASYLAVAHRGLLSPFAPYAYLSASRIYEQKNDRTQERAILTEAAGLNDESPFIKNAQELLKALNAAAAPATDATAPADNSVIPPAATNVISPTTTP